MVETIEIERIKGKKQMLIMTLLKRRTDIVEKFKSRRNHMR
jgi:hypothetical protein